MDPATISARDDDWIATRRSVHVDDLFVPSNRNRLPGLRRARHCAGHGDENNKSSNAHRDYIGAVTLTLSSILVLSVVPAGILTSSPRVAMTAAVPAPP